MFPEPVLAVPLFPLPLPLLPLPLLPLPLLPLPLLPLPPPFAAGPLAGWGTDGVVGGCAGGAAGAVYVGVGPTAPDVPLGPELAVPEPPVVAGAAA